MPLAAGSRLGSYEILAPLGAGGMGEVYRARDTKLARDVAIKVLPATLAHDSAALKRFEREARAAAALSHPNILAIHDFANSDGVTYAVTELLQGETLRQRLDHGALAPRRAAEMGRDIALGLAAAHERGLVHRDLKPGNLFLTRDGVVKILDFGLVRQVVQANEDRTQTDATEPGKVLGTAGYMSPEQVRGDPADHRSDIFSFGTVLYEMLSGRRAFKGATSVETMNAILREEPPPLSPTGREIAPVLERIVSHCLEKRPEDRFQSARDLAFDLGALSTASASGAAASVGVKSPWWRRTAIGAAALAIGVLGVFAGIRVGADKSSDPITARRLTFRRGGIHSARFTPDGKTVVYSAAWEDRPPELFSVRTDSVESTPLGVEKANLLSVSSDGQLAIILRKLRLRRPSGPGTLARLPLGGGAPRELMSSVYAADWAPDGKDLAIVRIGDGNRWRLEYPMGRLLQETPLLIEGVRISPDGTGVATTAQQSSGGVAILVFDANGRKRALTTLDRVSGFAWSPDSREIYFVGGRTVENVALHAIDLDGHERVLFPTLGANVVLHDVSRDGRFLLERVSHRLGVACRVAGEVKEREIGWFDGSVLRGGSDDGRIVVLYDVGDGGSRQRGAYVRRCDGSPAIWIGDGEPVDLSPDGEWVLAFRGSELWMLPVGVGSPRRIPLDAGIELNEGEFLPDGRRIFAAHNDPDGNDVFSLISLEGERRVLVLPDFGNRGLAFSPDGEQVAYENSDGKLVVVATSGGAPRELPGPPPEPGELIASWSGDGRYLHFAKLVQMPGQFLRREIATGKRAVLFEIQPADTTGVTGFRNAGITPDGRSYGYTYYRTEASDLFVVDGLK